LKELRDCENIIRLREVYESDLDVHIVMSYANLGTFKNIQNPWQARLSEDELKSIM